MESWKRKLRMGMEPLSVAYTALLPRLINKLSLLLAVSQKHLKILVLLANSCILIQIAATIHIRKWLLLRLNFLKMSGLTLSAL